VPLPEAGAHIVFHIPMPRSWSKKKRSVMNGQPHKQRPDADNLFKALADAIYGEDSHIHDVRISKVWSETGRIEIRENTASAEANFGSNSLKTTNLYGFL
jgi:Holliday junction resolvase RusA-like endonuclease